MKVNIKYLLIVLILTTVNTSYSQDIYFGGTSIIMRAGRDSIWICADSKSSSNTGNMPEKYKAYGNHCKIVHGKNLFIASAGANNYLFQDDSLIFSIENTSKRSILNGNSFNQILTYFYNDVKAYLNYFVRTSPELFDSLLKKENLMESYFGTFVNNKPSILYLKFKIFGDYEHWRVDTVCEFSSNTRVYLIGFQDAALRYIRSYNDFLKIDSIPMFKKLEYLINLEVKEHPDHVGLPIDAFVLYKNGYRWNLKHQKCSD